MPVSLAKPVNLRKPVSLVKRPRSGEEWVSLLDYWPIVNYVKVTGEHAAHYWPENERYNTARCTDDVPVGACPSCDPYRYSRDHAKHRSDRA